MIEKEDIEILVKYFLKKLDIKNGQLGKKVSTYYINKLKEHNWSGNVRELRNVVERDYYLSEISLDLSNYIDEESFAVNAIEKEKEKINVGTY